MLISSSEPGQASARFRRRLATVPPAQLQRLERLDPGISRAWAEKIPYQPIGGVDRATGGFVNKDNVISARRRARLPRTDDERSSCSRTSC